LGQGQEGKQSFRQEEIDQLVAPIALYPDSLISQVLMASTYPLEVVQADRWAKQNKNLKGDALAAALEKQSWDPSVKSLVAFPQILHRMDEQLDWTQRLGEAFLAQEPHVMDAIQGLRQQAARAGNLRSNEQMRVVPEDRHIAIEPARPQVVYVPYYDPAVVYGPWWWPAYPPVYWAPWPGYFVGPAYAPGFFWGSGIVISTGFFFGHFDWHHRHVKVAHVHHRHPPIQAERRAIVHHPPDASGTGPARWQHDPIHRRGVPFRHTVLRQQFGQSPAVRSDERTQPANRFEARGAQPQTRNAAPQTRALTGAPNTRSEHFDRFTPQAGSRPSERNERAQVQRPQSRAPEPRPAVAAPFSGPAPRLAASAPVARAEQQRPAPPAANVRIPPHQQDEPARHAEARAPARESAMIPRAAAGAQSFLPRMDSNLQH
ncbi:MAG: DUF3300 domain-containing protein, partial [Burkholderiales bacterium]